MNAMPDPLFDVFEVLKDALKDPETSWSIGTFGALAEFFHDGDQPAHISESPDHLSAETPKGRLSIAQNDQMRLLAYEGLSTLPTAWTQGVLVLLPTEEARLAHRTGIAEVEGHHSQRTTSDPSQVLFDLGLGVPHLDACIRTDDPQLISNLRTHLGRNLFSKDVPLEARIKAVNPDRVFQTKIASIEVYQDIPDPLEETPLGPHTHLSERLLSHKRTHAATIPVEDGWVPVLAFYPPHPVRDLAGGLAKFDLEKFNKFQKLLQSCGASAALNTKADFYQAMATELAPQDHPPLSTKQQRTAIRIAIRQYGHQFGETSLLKLWRAAYEPARQP